MLATYTSKGYIKKKFEFYLNFEGTTVKKKPVVHDKKKTNVIESYDTHKLKHQ